MNPALTLRWSPVLLVALALGCAVARDADPAPSNVEQIVLETALDHFRGLEEANTVQSAGSLLLVHHETGGPSMLISEVQVSSDLDHRSRFREVLDLRVALETANEVVHDVPLEGSDPRWIVMDLETVPWAEFAYSWIRERFPDARAMVRAWQPAIDGEKALVRFTFGPTPHGAVATYLLRRHGNDWRVAWHDVVFYL